jgi:hypothetical protein
VSAAGGVLQFDVTIQNLLNEGIGTPDGIVVDTAGIPVVFAAGPRTSGGTGSVTVANPDGLRSSRPYFRYAQKLARDEVSAPRTWRFAYDPGVVSFTFRLAVVPEIQPLLVINEMLTNARSEGTTTPVLDTSGEWIEIYNAGTLPVDLEGLLIADSAASGVRPYHRIASSVVVAPGGYAVLGVSSNTTFNGGVPVDYAYGFSAISLGNFFDSFKISRVYGSDTLTLDRTGYNNGSISSKDGISRELKNPSYDNANMDGSEWGDAAATAVYGPGGRGTPKAQNSTFTP